MVVSLKYGKAWLEEFAEELIQNPNVLAFLQKVDVEPDYELDKLV